MSLSQPVFDDVVTEETRNVVFRPNPGPQTAFLAAPQREVLYGGSAGGGKSYALLADALRDIAHPNFNGLLVRKTTQELRELKQKSQELYPQVFPNRQIRWYEKDSTWRHANGGALWMNYLERDEDVSQYQGQAFTWIGFDELTQWGSPYAWNYLRSRLRTTASDLGLYMRATTNPGGRGHAWVKKMFIDPAPWGQSFWARDHETGEVLCYPEFSMVGGKPVPHPKAGQPLFKRRFIPSRLSDNPYLYNAGDYEAMLLSLPEAERKRLLEGDWDVMEGAAFPEWNRAIHVVEPFEIPTNWRKFRACDYGYRSHSAVLWFAVTPSDQLVVYRELYVKGVLAVDLADMVLNLERDDGVIHYGVLDSSTWYNRGDAGPSIAEQMIARGTRWRPSDRSKGARIAGKNEIHRRLQVDEFTGEPRVVVFNTCVNGIAQMPILPLDPSNPEDVDTDSEDHWYDAFRYGIMSRPRNHTWDYNPESKRFQPFDEVFGY